ncbi:hypothetical protein VHEMI00178 [[Torrubiella] hemipterigena]|uniref:Uncharacterized protein n=1 Tax=[Torrubiella] hemipterigena TaxID=1531966 RepID=A0A0A1T3Q1_9HYPO|nr:hypothetical protein VHEMI00178 [[Torrubiella] hemipterigena]
MRVSLLATALATASVAVASLPGGGDLNPPTIDVSRVVTTIGNTPSTNSVAPIATPSSSTSSTSAPHTVSTHVAPSTDVSSTPSSHQAPNATSSKPADQTGGAILPHMQGSMVGLLGFCIMSLIML